MTIATTVVTTVTAAQADTPATAERAERMARAEREDTRARILAEAVDLFAANGFASTTTRELAEHMGFTKAALYYHFRTKDDLLAALVEPIADEIAALTGAPRAQGDAGRGDLLAGYLDLVVSHRRLFRVLYQDPAISRNEKVRATVRESYKSLVAALRVPGQDPVTAGTRVRAALGSIHAALRDDVPEAEQPLVRVAALMAACGALGIGFTADTQGVATAHVPPQASATN